MIFGLEGLKMSIRKFIVITKYTIKDSDMKDFEVCALLEQHARKFKNDDKLNVIISYTDAQPLGDNASCEFLNTL